MGSTHNQQGKAECCMALVFAMFLGIDVLCLLVQL